MPASFTLRVRAFPGRVQDHTTGAKREQVVV